MTIQLAESRLTLGAPKIGVIIPVYGDSDSVCWILGRFRQSLVNTICLVVDIPSETSHGQDKRSRKANRDHRSHYQE